MAASVKEKNMPTIPSNKYGGLQKWVSRASHSIRRARRNSDASQTMYKPYSPEMNGFQDYNQGKIVPSHGRSRSTPVMMPDPDNYLNTIDQTYRKTSDDTKTSLQQEALLEPWGRRESKDDTSRPRERKNAFGGRPLRRSCSKSESSLLEAAKKSEALKSRSKTTPPKNRVRRTSSQDTEESTESCSTSDLDFNYNINKNSRSSQASRKANKRERAQTLESKIDSNGGGNRLNEKLRKSSSHDKIARDVKARLDKWVDKTAGFHDSKQSSFESTSSSDDLSDILSKRDNNQAVSTETREMRELQNALEELVSSCGRSSRKSSDEEAQLPEAIEATNTRANRKISLKDTGSMFCKAVDIDYHSSQSVRQNEYRLKTCGSSSGSAGSGSSNTDPSAAEKQSNSEFEESYDSVDGKAGEIENRGMEESYETKDSLNCDNDIGRGSEESLTRVSTAPENFESEMNNQTNHVDSLESKSHDEVEVECQQENQESKYYDKRDNYSVPETKQTETDEQFSKQNHPVGGMKDDIVDANRTKLPRSTKSYRAPPPPTKERKSKLSDVIFNDDALDAFAEECLRHADKKKKKTKERESKSDSEDEKRGLKVDFVYIKTETDDENLAHSYPGPRILHNKAATHPKTSYDESHLAYITLSDNELERNEIPLSSRIREKRHSVDSLDGRVLFDLSPSYNTDYLAPQYNTDSKYEDEHSSDGLKSEEELATESTASGMRKFPSMPLFYVPKEFDDQSGEFKRIKSASIRKSLWKRIKSLPRHSAENNRVNNTKTKRKEEDNTSAQAQLSDPFYHGENEEQDVLGPSFRTKAWTMSGTRISHPGSQRRPSLEARRSVPTMKVMEVNEQQRDRLLNDYVVIPAKNGDESQC